VSEPTGLTGPTGPQPLPEPTDAGSDAAGAGAPAGPPPGSTPNRPLSRRALLARLAMGSAAAGAAAVLGAAVYEEATRSPRHGTVSLTSTTIRGPAPHRLAAAASTLSSGGAQIFRSRPDLRPPAITVDVRSRRPATDLVLTDSHAGPTQQGPMIIDGQGDLVWFLPLSPGTDAGLRAFNLRAWSYRGKDVLSWFQGAVVSAHGQGHYEVFDSSYNKIVEVRAQNGYQGDLHEFLITEQGTALFTCYGEAPADLSRFGGAKKGSYFYGVVQEVDLSTGKLIFEWRSDQHTELTDSYLTPDKEGSWDYFHINSIDVDPTDGNLIISGRNTWAFYKVKRRSGKVLWQVGGKRGDFSISPNARFAFQHDVRRSGDGTITLFDNEGGPPAEAKQSRALVLSLDEGKRKASFVHQYFHSPPVLSEALGSVQDAGGGARFVGWGESGYFTEYDPSGAPVFDARLTPGTESYRAFKQPWQGQPANPPSVAIVPGAAGATVYASWNGATEVAGWVVLGGHAPDHLEPLGVAPRMGFETVITVPSPPPYLAVEAVTATDAVLARSQPKAVH
jgi:Arylsulfotransferase (ASST)